MFPINGFVPYLSRYYIYLAYARHMPFIISFAVIHESNQN